MWRRHICYVCKRSVCGGDEPQPVAHLSHKLQCARQSLKIMVSYGNKYPRHNARPHVVEQSGQCARALSSKWLICSHVLTPANATVSRIRKVCNNYCLFRLLFDQNSNWFIKLHKISSNYHSIRTCCISAAELYYSSSYSLPITN